MQNNLVFAKMLGVFGINRNDEKVAELLKSNGINATKLKRGEAHLIAVVLG